MSEEVHEEQLKLENINTVKNENKAVNAFKNYLAEIGLEDMNFFTFTEAKLDRHLTTFWFNARTKNGENYSASSLDTIRYGLNRALKKYGHSYDITKKECSSFTESIGSFESAQRKLTKFGKGHVKNYKEIKPTRKFLVKHLWHANYKILIDMSLNQIFFQKNFLNTGNKRAKLTFILKISDWQPCLLKY